MKVTNGREQGRRKKKTEETKEEKRIKEAEAEEKKLSIRERSPPAINLKSDFASSYMYLAITLSRMDDFANACTAYDKAINADPDDPLFHLNYAITLFNHTDHSADAKREFDCFENLYDQLDEEAKIDDKDIIQQRAALQHIFQ